eukprot:12186-Heterococcus_DN1.PRE.3
MAVATSYARCWYSTAIALLTLLLLHRSCYCALQPMTEWTHYALLDYTLSPSLQFSVYASLVGLSCA